ncbi:MAG TPA: hypothetical protein VLM18_12865 [Croceibacterium sp.]|nr:hypothetical protein [Croceibacterium sp.]
MNDFILARAIHVLSVVMWIGGVAFVTTVAMPAVRRTSAPEERLEAFQRFEARFAPQARAWVVLAGASGLWMIWRADMWGRFQDGQDWWMHAMVCLWALFALMLFVVEPFFLHRRMEAAADPARVFSRMEWMHRVLLTLSLLTVAAAVAGSHGWSF